MEDYTLTCRSEGDLGRRVSSEIGQSGKDELIS